MNTVRRYLDLIKFEHTIFAMPFALVSLLVATGGRPFIPPIPGLDQVAEEFWRLRRGLLLLGGLLLVERAADWCRWRRLFVGRWGRNRY